MGNVLLFSYKETRITIYLISFFGNFCNTWEEKLWRNISFYQNELLTYHTTQTKTQLFENMLPSAQWKWHKCLKTARWMLRQMNLAFANSSYQLIKWYWYAMILVFTESCLQTGYTLFHELGLLSFQHSIKSETNSQIVNYRK